MEKQSTSDVRLIERSVNREDRSQFLASLPQLAPGTRLLHVDYLYSPRKRIELWHERGADAVDELGIVYAGYGHRDGEEIETYGESLNLDTTCTCVQSPKDVQGIGLEITKFFDRIAADEHPTVLFVDSLSVLLQYVPLDVAVQFVRQCLTQCQRYDVGARFYLSPEVHEPEVTERVQSLFSE